MDWFNKYVVNKVTQTDPTGGAPALVTAYSYSGGAGWHFDDNEVVQAKYRTYGQFRGYADVKTYTGDGVNDPQTHSETTYYRGMSKNNNTTVVNVTDSAGWPARRRQRPRRHGVGVHRRTWATAARSTTPPSPRTGCPRPPRTRGRTGLSPLTANLVAPAETYTRQAVTDGGTTTWRYTETDTAYDATITDAPLGLPTRSYTHTVPANPAYDRCSHHQLRPGQHRREPGRTGREAETDSVACGGFTQGSPGSVPAALNTLTAPAC